MISLLSLYITLTHYLLYEKLTKLIEHIEYTLIDRANCIWLVIINDFFFTSEQPKRYFMVWSKNI